MIKGRVLPSNQESKRLIDDLGAQMITVVYLCVWRLINSCFTGMWLPNIEVI